MDALEHLFIVLMCEKKMKQLDEKWWEAKLFLAVVQNINLLLFFPHGIFQMLPTSWPHILFVRLSGIERGLDVDKFAPRLSFFWGIGMNFYMVWFSFQAWNLKRIPILWEKIQLPYQFLLWYKCKWLTKISFVDYVIFSCFYVLFIIFFHKVKLHFFRK